MDAARATRRPRRSFPSRLEPLEPRALLNATIDVDADGRLDYRSDPALASALRVSQDGDVYTFDLGAAGPDIDVTGNAAGLAVTGSGTRTVTVAGPSAIQLVALADSDSVLLASSAVPVVALLQARGVAMTVGDQSDPRGLDAISANVAVFGSGVSSGDSLVVDDRGWRNPNPSNWGDRPYFTVKSDSMWPLARSGYGSLGYAGISALTLDASAAAVNGRSISTFLSTAPGVDTRLDLGATTNTQHVDVQSTSADAGSRLTILGGQGALQTRIDASSSPVAIRGGPGSAANILTATLRGMGPGAAISFDGGDGTDSLWIDAGGLPISSSDFRADPSGALVFAAEAPQSGTITATKVEGARVVNLASKPSVLVDSRPVVSTGPALTDVIVGEITSYPSAFAPRILWGDGAVSDGVAVADPADPNHFFVRGSHTYAAAGTYTPGLIVHAFDVVQSTSVAGATVEMDFGATDAVSRNALALSGSPSGVIADGSTYATNDPDVGASGLVSSLAARVDLYATPRGGSPIFLGESTPGNSTSWAVASGTPLPDGLYTLSARAFDDSTGLASALTTLPYSLVVDTVGPRIVNMSIDARRGRILVTYRDYGGYRNRGVGVDPNEAAGAIYYDLANTTGQSFWKITSAVASPGWNPSFLRVALQINDGAPLANGTYRLSIAAYRTPTVPITSPFGSFIYAGVRDKAFNGLDGGFTGRFPTQGAGGFEGQFVVRRGRALPIRPVAAALTARPVASHAQTPRAQHR